MNPEYINAYYNKANTLKSLKLNQEALKVYDYILKIKPDFALAYNNKGIILSEMNKYDEALTEF